jgi:hypothetical protein
MTDSETNYSNPYIIDDEWNFPSSTDCTQKINISKIKGEKLDDFMELFLNMYAYSPNMERIDWQSNLNEILKEAIKKQNVGQVYCFLLFYNSFFFLDFFIFYITTIKSVSFKKGNY